MSRHRHPASPLRTRRPLALRLAAGPLLVAGLAAALSLAAPPSAVAADPPAVAAELAAVQELLDAERPEEALARLAPLLARRPDHPQGLVMRSTARLMLGDIDAGRRDLERALALDPENRRGWLNRAALEVAEGRYEAALEAFRTAERLDPGAADNHLNIGAVELLAGRLGPASERFRSYLAGAGGSADGAYLVATNYALAGYASLAVEHLRLAIEADERSRLRARSDPNFADLTAHPGFAALMSSDLYAPPPGSYTAESAFSAPYRADGSGLLTAVIDALQLGGHPFDPRVEVTAGWALVQGELRIKITNRSGPDGEEGVVVVSAPPDGMTPAQWRERTESLFRDVRARLAVRSFEPR